MSKSRPELNDGAPPFIHSLRSLSRSDLILIRWCIRNGL